ncbi:MAG: DUF72 domain-containing protein [Myxococcales bacterium]|nr:DUF72 domain-containing protein [Myxococcales bacterium]
MWGYRNWFGRFYPEGTRQGDALARYAERLTTVEGNTTFYATPSAEVVDRWAAETPESFRFCPKLPKTVTHNGELAPRLGELTRFVERCARLGPRLGPLFGIIPDRHGPARAGDLERFLDGWSRRVVERFPELRPELALETRNSDWLAPPHSRRLSELLHAHGVARVMLDTRPVYERRARARFGDPQEGAQHRKPELPVSLARTADFTLIRFISHPQPEVTGPYLAQWAPRVHAWLDQGVRVYFFAHCPDDTDSPELARRFHHALAGRGAPVDPLPWDAIRESPSQLALVD